MSRALWIAAVIASSGCMEDALTDVDDQEQAIVGGTSALGFPGVVIIGGCTGTVIAPRVVLSAAHCGISPGDRAAVLNISDPVSEHTVIAVHNHRLFNDDGTVGPADVAVAYLDSDPQVEAHPFPIDPIAGLVGNELVSVGFGANDAGDFSGFGTKRTARFILDFVNEEFLIGEGTMGEVICFGDSGGPAFLEQGDDFVVVGIASRTSGCRSNSGWTRVDHYSSNFIVPALDSFVGPCAFDGRCETNGCRTPDPDCAPCGLDGECSTGCDVVDLDCPPKLGYTQSCNVDDDCESLLCVEGQGDEGLLCALPCSQDGACPSQAECVERPQGSVCVPQQFIADDGGCGCSSDRSGTGWLTILLVPLLGIGARRVSR